MAGSASIDNTKLIDRFVGLTDRLRGQLNTAYGTRQWHLDSVRRRFVDGTVGVGRFEDTVLRIDPDPKIEAYAFKNQLQATGLDEVGILLVKQVSLTYTEAELGGAEEPGVQHFFRLVEAHGQGTRTRYFANRVPPYPDRIRTLGWMLELEVIKDPAAPVDPAADAAGEDPMSVAPGAALAKDLGDLSVDASSAAQHFDYIVPSGKRAVVQRITIAIRTTTTPTDDGFGDIAVLDNGVLLQFLDTDLSVLLDVAAGVAICRNDDWGMIAGADVDVDTTLNQIRCTITLSSPIELEAGQRFRATVDDDLSGLEEFRVQLRGYTEND